MEDEQHVKLHKTNTRQTKQKNQRKQDAVISAFDSIFEIYKHPKALSDALESAKQKLSSLKAEFLEANSNQTTFDKQYEKISNELWTLADMVDKLHANPDVSSATWVTTTMNQVHAFAELAEGYGRTAEERLELQNEIDETYRFITMLQGAKAVADAGGMKFHSGAGVNNKDDQVQLRHRVRGTITYVEDKL